MARAAFCGRNDEMARAAFCGRNDEMAHGGETTA
jgi:hypothetical protein